MLTLVEAVRFSTFVLVFAETSEGIYDIENNVLFWNEIIGLFHISLVVALQSRTSVPVGPRGSSGSSDFRCTKIE